MAFRISKTEMHHYKSEFDALVQGKDSLQQPDLEKFLGKLRLSDHDIKKIINLISSDGQIKLPNFIAAMRLASLIKQGKKYSKDDMFVEQKILARKSKAAELKPDVNKPAPAVPNRCLTKINVLNPTLVKAGWFGAGSFYTYSISSVVDSCSHQVTRRFSDIDWLFKVLQENYKGYIIPELPEKKIINNTDPLFIEQRRVDIETFLNALNNHEVLGASQEFLAFLKVPDDKFQSFKESEQTSTDLFEVKSLRDTLDQTLASIETKFQSFSNNDAGSEFKAIRSETESKKLALNQLVHSFNITRLATQENDSNFFKVFQGLGLETHEIDRVVQKSRNQFQQVFEGISEQQEKFSELSKTFEVFLTCVEKKKTVKNLRKRKALNADCEKEDEVLNSLEVECERVLVNIKKEVSSVERNYLARIPLVIQSFCESQHERFLQFGKVLNDLK